MKNNLNIKKILILLFILLMVGIILTAFFKNNPIYEITDNMVYILIIIAIILLFDSIESFSIGNILSLKKEIKNKENEVSKLSSENKELKNQLISIINSTILSVNNNSNNQHVSAIFNLQQATEQEKAEIEKEEINKKVENETEEHENFDNKKEIISSNHSRIENRRLFKKEIQNLLLQKFSDMNNYPLINIQKDIRFSENFIDNDPIINKVTLFEGYINTPFEDILIQTRIFESVLFEYQLYYLISKIYHFSKGRNKSVKLVLLTPSFPDSKSLDFIPLNQTVYINRIIKYFEPAIKSGLLQICNITFTEEECEEILNRIDKQILNK